MIRIFQFPAAWIGLGLLLCAGSAWPLDGDAALKQLMQEQYGAYSASAKGWPFRSEDVAYVMKIISSKKIVTPYGERLYLFAAGDVASDKDSFHAQGGLAGAFVLEERDGKVVLVAAGKAMKFGSFGATSDKVELRQFGPDHYYGWIYESGYTGQGYTASYSYVLLPRGKNVAELARIPAHMDNEGNYSCDDKAARKDCESLDFDLKIESGATGVKVYPLAVTRKGIEKGKDVKLEVLRVLFDEKKWRYEVPAALKIQY